MFDGTSVAITGGTGSFGKKFVETLLTRYRLHRLIVFSRDELKQYEMSRIFPNNAYPALRYFIGDVRDPDRLYEAFRGVDYVIHAAAIKQVPAAEYNPFEAIKTNVLGAQNVIRACIERGVKRVIALSTDKAAAPINLYGATKLCSDKLFVAANSMSGGPEPRFSVVRYGNVFGSRGSVVPLFLKQRKSGSLTITDERMTRFSITLQAGVDFVIKTMEIMNGGGIYVPKIPSYRITDVAEAVSPNVPVNKIGIRAGEKLHEVMIPEDESWHTLEFDDYYVILPSDQWSTRGKIMMKKGAKACSPGFVYSSGTNDWFLSVDELRSMVRQGETEGVYSVL
ncbi:MAG: UDP-N-acetylglucosamine 4,6-dehydratase (inverting) [Deltaproteobacteria bacterium]|nr:UDP-N-acetylglucosamine 4,6-dehydratase (inverting) [Deltaproteobacteria bacterium]MBN2674139.1 UDP-N-acetylglucosamine 4,6-dehydratase (inverting) [Deltaproteobacteria bacterium]